MNRMTALFNDSAYKSEGGAFAVRAGNVNNGRKAILRIIQCFQNAVSPFKAKIDLAFRKKACDAFEAVVD